MFYSFIDRTFQILKKDNIELPWEHLLAIIQESFTRSFNEVKLTKSQNSR